MILRPGFKDNGGIDKVAGCFPGKINIFRNSIIPIVFLLKNGEK